DRARPLYELHLLLPGRRDGAAGRDDRGDRAHPAPQAPRAPAGDRRPGGPHARRGPAHGVAEAGPRSGRMSIGLAHYLAVAAILFTIGVFGIFVNRKNVIVILMS